MHLKFNVILKHVPDAKSNLIKSYTNKMLFRASDSDIALIKNNAKAGAEIAVGFSELCRGPEVPGAGSRKVHVHGTSGSEIRPVVIGGSNVDSTVKVVEDAVKVC